MNRQTRNKAIIILLVVGPVVLAVVLFAIWKINSPSTYVDQVKINGYSDSVKNLPGRYKDLMSAALYNMVEFNSKDSVDPSAIDDAQIREGTVDQSEVTQGRQYTGSYIVDIESVRQSYFVQYGWSNKPDLNVQSGYTVMVSCLSPSELKWGDFKCKNLHDGGADLVDPIVSKLPHKTLSFELKADTTGDKLKLHAKLLIPEVDLRSTPSVVESVVGQYKEMVLGWIRSQGLNPDTYSIEWVHPGIIIPEEVYDGPPGL